MGSFSLPQDKADKKKGDAAITTVKAAAKEAKASKGAKTKKEKEKAGKIGKKSVFGGGGGGGGRGGDGDDDSKSNGGNVGRHGHEQDGGGGGDSPPGGAGGAGGAVISPGSALKSPDRRRHGKLHSARDASRLSLMHRRMQVQMGMGGAGGQLSPVKTRASRQLAALGGSPKQQKHTTSSGPSAEAAGLGSKAEAAGASGSKALSAGAAGGKATGKKAAASAAAAAAAEGGGKEGSSVPDEHIVGSVGGGKAVKQWLNRSARAANVVGRGAGAGGGGGWDDAPVDGDAPKPAARKGAGGAGGGGRGKKGDAVGGKEGRGAFKRRREYDDLDEDYDRGRISKHARRKAEGGKSTPSKGFGGGKSRNPFQSAAKLKKEQ